MTTVYPATMFVLFAPLGGMADEAPDIDPRLQPDVVDEKALKQIYEEYLKPVYVAMKPPMQDATKTTLRYFLNDEKLDHKGQLEVMMLPFGFPDVPRNAFLWLWEVLIPDEKPQPLVEPTEVVQNLNTAEMIRRISSISGQKRGRESIFVLFDSRPLFCPPFLPRFSSVVTAGFLGNPNFHSTKKQTRKS